MQSRITFDTQLKITLLPKNIIMLHPYPLYNGHLSTLATFFCPQGGHYGELWL